MKKVFVFLLITILICGCSKTPPQTTQTQAGPDPNAITLTSGICSLKDGFSAVRYDGDYGFDEFIEQGGAKSDSEVIGYLAQKLGLGIDTNSLIGGQFGCSTISVQSPKGEHLFGRNFDWQNCDAMVVAAYPKNGYNSISTVNMDFLTQYVSDSVADMANLSDNAKTIAALYAPLDGVNEAGLAVSVNMIADLAVINQDTQKPDITTTTAIRLLLDKASNVAEAVELLGEYDMHSSMDLMVHFAIADTDGNSVAVEYIENEMVVTPTPVMTNFYLAEGDKYGIGTEQSHQRYDILTASLEQNPAMTIEQVRDALDSVSRDNFEEFESTEWSVVYNQSTGMAQYYHRENYDKSFTFYLDK